MRMLIISSPCALLGSRFLINVEISAQVKVIAKIDLSFFLTKFKGSLLELCIIEHFLANNNLIYSAFFLKHVTYLLS